MDPARWSLPFALAGVAVGILAADLDLAPPSGALTLGGMTAVAIGLMGGSIARPVALAGIVALGMGLGAWRQATVAAAPLESAVVADLVDGSEHDLVGTVTDDPRPRADRIQVVLGDLAVGADGRVVSVADRLLVWLPRGIDARSGTRLGVRARIELAEDFDGFAYGSISRARASAASPERAARPSSQSQPGRAPCWPVCGPRCSAASRQ